MWSTGASDQARRGRVHDRRDIVHTNRDERVKREALKAARARVPRTTQSARPSPQAPTPASTRVRPHATHSESGDDITAT